MNERKPIKISLSTFFLIITIIVIVIMGYFMYQLYNGKAVAEEQTAELNSKVNELQSTINNVQSVITNTTQTNVKEPSNSASVQEQASKNYSYKDIKGVYKFTKQVQENGETYNPGCELCLYENGTFEYSFWWYSGESIFGNYIVDNDTIILNKLFKGASDVAVSTTKGEIKLKINADGSITDMNSEITNFLQEQNVKLNKLSEREEQEYLKANPSIMTRINASITEKAIFKGEN